MATEQVIIQIEARGVNRVSRDVRRLGRESHSTASALGFLRAALVVIASARVLKGLTDLADSFTNVQNRLRLVTNNQKELIAVQETLFKVSNETRVGFEETATLFNRIARSTLGLGLNFKELIGVTRTVNQTVAIAGATSQEARNALIQFSQGLAVGALRGDELRSVAEQLTPLLDIIAKEFNKTTGEIVALAKKGKLILETERIVKALQESAEPVAEQFGKLAPTIDQAFTRINNALVKFFGNLNTTTGFAGRLANLLIKVADNIDIVILSVTALLGILAFNFVLTQLTLLGTIVGSVLTAAFGGLVTVVTALIAAFKALTVAILANPLFAAGALVAIGGLVALFVAFREEGESLGDTLGRAFNKVVDGIQAAIAAVNTLIKGFRLLPDAIDEQTLKAANALRRNFGIAVNEVILQLNRILPRALELDVVDVKELPNEFLGATSQLRALFDTELARIEVRTKGFTTNVKQTLTEFITFVRKFVQDPQFDPAALLGRPPGSKDTSNAIKELSDAFLKAEKALRRLEARFSTLISVQQALTDAQKTINEARDEGVKLLADEQTLLRNVERETLGLGPTQEQLADKVEALNDAFRRQVITAGELETAVRDAKIEFLDAQRSIAAGAQRAFLKLVDEATDAASTVEDLLTSAFKAAEDAVVSFAQTGKFEFKDFIRTISEELIRLGTRQALAGIGGFFTGDFGALGPQNSGFSPLGNVGGLFSKAGGFFKGLLGFQGGGGFTVGANTAVASLPGLDNRLVAFRAQDGEKVDVTPRGQVGATQPITQVFNISTPDADSFRRSQTQIQNRGAAALSRARSRR